MLSSQIIDTGLRIYRQLAWQLVRRSALPTLLIYVGIVQVFAFIVPNLFTTHHPDSDSAQLLEVATALSCALFVSIPLAVAGIAYPMAYTAKMAGALMLGDKPDDEEAHNHAISRLSEMVKLVLPSLLLGAAPLGGALVLLGISNQIEHVFGADSAYTYLSTGCIVCGFLLALFTCPLCLVSLSFAAPALALEPIDWRSAYKRSKALRKSYPIHGGVGGTLSTLFIVALFAYAAIDGATAFLMSIVKELPFIENVLQGPATGQVIGGMLDSIPMYVTNLFLIPFYTCIAVVAYYERRVRLEALDIRLLSEDLHHKTRRATPGS